MTIETETADVSVIIPAFRAAGTIGRALASVAAQRRPPREVVVVDDGSDDGTADAAEAMRGALGRIALQVIRQPNQGAGAARNSALAAATGALVAFLDADDEWLPEKLARSLPCLDDPEVVLVAHNYIRRHPNGSEETIDCTRHVHGASPFAALYQRGYIGTCTVVARRHAVKAAGGFDSGLKVAQDFALWLALLKAPGTRFEVFGEALSRYHLRPGSITTDTETRLDCCLDVARRFYPALRDHSGVPLVHLWFRVLAVHYEAAVVYARRGSVGRWTWNTLRCPAALFGITANVLAEGERDWRRPLEALLWLWAVGVIAAYMAQFRPYLEPIARTVGLL
jgi:glycosyltransferase involved in cell wall biosynthesis